MQFEVFELERNQSLFENEVEYNLSESGVHPLKLSEVLTKEEQEQEEEQNDDPLSPSNIEAGGQSEHPENAVIFGD